jgi:hypothetical protein
VWQKLILQTSRNTKHHRTSSRGSRVPSYVRPHDGEQNLSLHLSRTIIVYGLNIDDDAPGSGQRRSYCSYGHRNNTTTNSSEHQFDAYNILQLYKLNCAPTYVYAKRRVPDASFCHEKFTRPRVSQNDKACLQALLSLMESHDGRRGVINKWLYSLLTRYHVQRLPHCSETATDQAWALQSGNTSWFKGLYCPLRT